MKEKERQRRGVRQHRGDTGVSPVRPGIHLQAERPESDHDRRAQSREVMEALTAETIGYNEISGNTLQNCVRGVDNSTPAGHNSGAVVTVRNLPNINVWPSPDQSNYYSFVYWRLRRIQDAGNGINTEDIPFRMLPCMAAGLAYYLSLKIPGAEPRIDMLKAAYEEQWQQGHLDVPLRSAEHRQRSGSW